MLADNTHSLTSKYQALKIIIYYIMFKFGKYCIMKIAKNVQFDTIRGNKQETTLSNFNYRLYK